MYACKDCKNCIWLKEFDEGYCHILQTSTNNFFLKNNKCKDFKTKMKHDE